MAQGTPWWPGPSVLVQSHRRQRLRMTMVEVEGVGLFVESGWELDTGCLDVGVVW